MTGLPDALVPFAAAWCAALGAVVGSFLNVVVARVPHGESVVRPGSRCPACRTPICWYDNVPVVSWLALRGRCRACRVRIPARYPLLELAGAGLGALAFGRHGLTPAAAAELGFAAALLGLALIDLETWLLPHAITWPLLAAGLGVNAAGVGPAAAVRPALYGAALGFAGLAAVAVAGEKVFRREAMGFGDVWLLAGIGAWLGHAALLPVVLLASIQGAAVGLTLVALGKGQPGPPEDAPATPELPAGDAAVPHGAPAAGDAATDAPIDAVLAAQTHPAPPSEAAWVPPRHAIPFGPFLSLAALEWLYLGDVLARAIPGLAVFR